MCKEIGKEPNKTYRGSLNVRIPGELHRDAAVLQSSLAPRYSLQTAEEAALYGFGKQRKGAKGKRGTTDGKRGATDDKRGTIGDKRGKAARGGKGRGK